MCSNPFTYLHKNLFALFWIFLKYVWFQGTSMLSSLIAIQVILFKINCCFHGNVPFLRILLLVTIRYLQPSFDLATVQTLACGFMDNLFFLSNPSLKETTRMCINVAAYDIKTLSTTEVELFHWFPKTLQMINIA